MSSPSTPNPSPSGAIHLRVTSRPIPLLTIKATSSSSASCSPTHSGSSGGAAAPKKCPLKRDLEQMEHAFLDLDEEDPSNDEWTFKAKQHSDKVIV